MYLGSERPPTQSNMCMRTFGGLSSYLLHVRRCSTHVRSTYTRDLKNEKYFKNDTTCVLSLITQAKVGFAPRSAPEIKSPAL